MHLERFEKHKVNKEVNEDKKETLGQPQVLSG